MPDLEHSECAKCGACSGRALKLIPGRRWAGGKEGCSAGRDGVALTRRKEAAGCGLGWVIFVALYKAELSSI